MKRLPAVMGKNVVWTKADRVVHRHLTIALVPVGRVAMEIFAATRTLILPAFAIYGEIESHYQK